MDLTTSIFVLYSSVFNNHVINNHILAPLDFAVDLKHTTHTNNVKIQFTKFLQMLTLNFIV